MHQRVPSRPFAAALASVLALGALAACDEGGTPEQTGQLPPADTQAGPNAQPGAQPAPPPAQD